MRLVLCRNIDICMMVAMNAKEREEADWEKLFKKADPGFKYLGTTRPTGSRMMLIEAEWEGPREGEVTKYSNQDDVDARLDEVSLF